MVAESIPIVVEISASSAIFSAFKGLASSAAARAAVRAASAATLAASAAAMIASACACVIVPFVTSAESVAARSIPRGPLTPLALGLVIEIRVAFVEAVETPTVPAVSATVVITIVAILFFVDIRMPPLSCSVPKPSPRLGCTKAS